jgi:hypothetical protein
MKPGCITEPSAVAPDPGLKLMLLASLSALELTIAFAATAGPVKQPPH